MLLFLLLALLLPDQLLVLKNGKIMRCTSFEVKGQVVHVRSGGQVFTLPLGQVDIDKSGDIPEEKKPEVSKAPVKKAPERNPPSISITTGDIKSKARSGESGTSRFRKIGNSIIVDVEINGMGPFAILLDTGASSTVLSPEILDKLKIIGGREPVAMIGLSNEQVNGVQVTLDQVSLAGQSVQNLDVVSFEIPHLTRMKVIGLLGQDFLNHFVVNLDPASREIRLTPHGRDLGPSSLARQVEVNRQLKRWEQSLARLRVISSDLEAILRRALTSSEGGEDEIPTLKGHSADIGEIRRTASNFKQSLSLVELETLPEHERDQIRQFQSCFPHLSSYLLEVQDLCRSLRIFFSSRQKSNLNQSLDQLERKNRELQSCFQ